MDSIRILTSVQQQTRDDCGWYAIAFATTLLHGHDPRKFCYEPKKFCNHFKKCLRERKLTSFPFCFATRSPTLRNEETSVIPVCYSCTRPEKLRMTHAVLSIGRRNVMSVKNGFTKNVRISQLKPNK